MAIISWSLQITSDMRGTDEKNMMNLLYLTVKVTSESGAGSDRLVRCVFELAHYGGAGTDAGAFPLCALRQRKSRAKENLFLFPGRHMEFWMETV